MRRTTDATAARQPRASKQPLGKKPGSSNAAGFITTQEAAALIGQQENTLRNWRCLNRGPKYYKLGQAVFYRESEVIDWALRQVRPTDEDS